MFEKKWKMKHFWKKWKIVEKKWKIVEKNEKLLKKMKNCWKKLKIVETKIVETKIVGKCNHYKILGKREWLNVNIEFGKNGTFWKKGKFSKKIENFQKKIENFQKKWEIFRISFICLQIR